MSRTGAIAAMATLIAGCSNLQSDLVLLAPANKTTPASKTAENPLRRFQSKEAAHKGIYLEASDSDTLDRGTAQASGKPNAAITELKIGYDTRSLEGVVLSKGPVEVKVAYTAREDITAENRPLLRYEISYDGELMVADSLLAVGYGRVIIGDFNRDGDFEVAVQGFTGGANCCTDSVVYSWQNSDFTKISLGEIGGEFKDIDGDGTVELVTKDPAFLYAFSSRAGSVLPPQIWRLDGDEFIEATRDYPDYIRASIAKMEETMGDRSTAAHSWLAAYVANKSLVGEYDTAWEYMLSHYRGEPEMGSAMFIHNESGDRAGQHLDFPTALEALLKREGYL